MEYSWLKYQYTGLIAVNKEPKKHKIQPGWLCTAAYQIPILFNRYIDTHHVCLFLPNCFWPHHYTDTHTRNQTPFIDRNLLCPAQMSPPHLFTLQSTSILYPFYHWIHLCSPVRHFLLCPQPYSHLDRTFFSLSFISPPVGRECGGVDVCSFLVLNRLHS